jgi:4-amino-4-deoxy-L-arabinose transferase-like glycosyltransferase
MATVFKQFMESAKLAGSGKYFLVLAIFAFFIFFMGLNSRHLWGGDEPRVAGIAAETVRCGNWLVPRLNGHDFLEKPPLYFWADAFSIKVFGHNEFAAKLPSAFAAFLGVLAVFGIGRALGFSKLGAMFASVMLATSAQYWRCGRKCMIDMFLAAFIIFAMWAFIELCRSEKLKSKIGWYILWVLGLGGAIFSKGLVGLAMPASALFFWLAIDDFWIERKFKISRWIWLFSGSLLCFIPVAVWVWVLYEKVGYDAVYTVVWTNNFGRFFGSHAEHVEPFYYYFRKLPEQLQPWTFLLPFALAWHGIQVWRKKSKYSLYMLCWLVIPYLLLMVSAGKRQVYVLPLYAAETLLIGSMVASALEGKIKLPKIINLEALLKIVCTVLCGALIIGSAVFAGLALYYSVGYTGLIAPVAMFIAGMIMLFAMLWERAVLTALALLFGLAAVFVSIDTAGFAAFNYKYSYHPMADFCQTQIDAGKQLYLYMPIERESGAVSFYLEKKVPSINSEGLEKLRKSLNAANVIVFARDDYYNTLKGVEAVAKFNVKRSDLYLFKFKGKK